MKNLSTVTIFILSIFFTISISAQTRQIGNFTGISVSSSVSVKLVKADSPRIEYKMIKGEDSSLITKIKGDKLIIKTKSTFGKRNNAQAKVILYYTELSYISVSAGASVKSEDPIKSQELDIDVSSGSIADFEVIANSIAVHASSGATLKLQGEAKKAEYDASSGATIKGKLMTCENVNAYASSGATILVHANKKIKAKASSGGHIRYTGDADDNNIDKGRSGQISRM